MSADELKPPGQTIWIARHGNRADFVDPEWPLTAQRPHDPPLSPDGIIQAKELGKRLLDEGISYIFASPFLRAVETAAHAAEILELPISIEHGACEWLNLEWFPSKPDCLSLKEMARLFPRVCKDYRPLVNPTYPETWEQVMARVGQTAKLLVDRFAGDALIIGHIPTVVGICLALLKGPPERIEAPLCGLTRIVREGDNWRLELNGDTSHLSQPREDRTFR